MIIMDPISSYGLENWQMSKKEAVKKARFLRKVCNGLEDEQW